VVLSTRSKAARAEFELSLLARIFQDQVGLHKVQFIKCHQDDNTPYAQLPLYYAQLN
jgi:hypothetical protein